MLARTPDNRVVVFGFIQKSLVTSLTIMLAWNEAYLNNLMLDMLSTLTNNRS